MKPRLELYNHLEEGRLSPSVADEMCIRHSPQAPEHLLLVPRKPIPRLSGAGEEDAALLGLSLIHI